jgi:hypothetical protein
MEAAGPFSVSDLAVAADTGASQAPTAQRDGRVIGYQIADPH